MFGQKKNSISECFFGYWNVQQFHLSSFCTFAKITFVLTAKPRAACCHAVAFANAPVFIPLCVSRLRIRVAVIHVIAGLCILENHEEKDQHAATPLFPDLNGMNASQIFCRESKSDLHNCWWGRGGLSQCRRPGWSPLHLFLCSLEPRLLLY